LYNMFTGKSAQKGNNEKLDSKKEDAIRKP
jgi:hypothetical protein